MQIPPDLSSSTPLIHSSPPPQVTGRVVGNPSRAVAASTAAVFVALFFVAEALGSNSHSQRFRSSPSTQGGAPSVDIWQGLSAPPPPRCRHVFPCPRPRRRGPRLPPSWRRPWRGPPPAARRPCSALPLGAGRGWGATPGPAASRPGFRGGHITRRFQPDFERTCSELSPSLSQFFTIPLLLPTSVGKGGFYRHDAAKLLEMFEHPLSPVEPGEKAAPGNRPAKALGVPAHRSPRRTAGVSSQADGDARGRGSRGHRLERRRKQLYDSRHGPLHGVYRHGRSKVFHFHILQRSRQFVG